MGVGDVVKGFGLQIAYTLCMIVLPIIWWNGMWSYGWGNHMSTFLAITGATLSGCCHAYRNLPVDLIPDWIPLIGKLDDGIAYILEILGGGLLLCGFLLSL
eukprot:m.77304 g.77304  ORF g.77304 m.77304 type:complete len:101 (+) comp12615_c0_seq6:201-503(+)